MLLLKIFIWRISASHRFELFTMKIKPTFLFRFQIHFKDKIIYFFSEFWFLSRHRFKSRFLRPPLNIFLWVTLIYYSKRVIKCCNSVKNFYIFWGIDTFDINPNFITYLALFSPYTLKNNSFFLLICSKR